MKFLVTTDVYPIGNVRNLPAIPGTKNTQEFDTEQGLGRAVWDGWKEMHPDVQESVAGFRTAFDEFLKFISGESRDNYPRVSKIEEVK